MIFNRTNYTVSVSCDVVGQLIELSLLHFEAVSVMVYNRTHYLALLMRHRSSNVRNSVPHSKFYLYWFMFYISRGFNGSVNIPESCDFQSQFDLLNIIF